MMYVFSTYDNNKSLVEQALFNEDTIETSGYHGVLFMDYSYMDIAVTSNLKINAYGGIYRDNGGITGKNLVIQKYNGTSYKDYKICETKSDGNRYELVSLEPGRYRLTAP